MDVEKKNRKIYTFFDGERDRRVDPMIVYKRISTVAPSLSIDIKVSQSASKDAIKAHDTVVAKIQEIFGVRPLDDTGGLTQGEMLDLLNDFMEWCSQVKKNSRTEQISSPPTEEVSPPRSLATEPGSDCGSTVNESITEGQAMSLSASE